MKRHRTVAESDGDIDGAGDDLDGGVAVADTAVDEDEQLDEDEVLEDEQLYDDEPLDDEPLDQDEPLDDEPLDQDEPLDDDNAQGRPGRFAGRNAGEILRELWTPKPRDRAARPAPTKEVVNGLSRQERNFGFAAAVLDVAISIEMYVAIRHLKGDTTHDVALRHQASTVLIAGLVGAVLLAAGAWFGRRALLGFAALIVGLELTTFGDIFGIVFIFFGGWLIVRHMRKQRQDREAGIAPARAAGSGWRRGASEPATAPARKPPPPSKRYTPPKSARTASSAKSPKSAGSGGTRRR